MPETPATNNATFNIGITMAGAGSAGCYTGGAMDYLFEILNLWQKAKDGQLPDALKPFANLIPRHNVVIDVMGGTSAGGMTTCMAALYALKGEIKPRTDPKEVGVTNDENIFYDSWVGLDDDKGKGGQATLSKAFDQSDLADGKFLSLLNSKIIDDIADHALTITGDFQAQVKNLPVYISRDLDILQVHTMLRGIPLSIGFAVPDEEVKGAVDLPAHNSFEHFMVAHYKLNNGLPLTAAEEGFLAFNPYDPECQKRLSVTTKSTGAFPIGLRFREMDNSIFSDAYLKCNTEQTVFNRIGKGKDPTQKPYAIDWENFPDNFSFVTIDGGAVNNEPFGEVYGILRNRYNECFEDGYPKYGIVMIDPFPDVVDKKAAYNPPDDVFSVIPAIINTLHEQSKVKKDDLLEAAEHPYFRGEIFPVKYVDGKKDDFPIASGTVSAFGGFLDIQFRHHDFFLGRDNARKYFRTYFVFEYSKHPTDTQKDIIHPIHQSWTADMIAAFQVTAPDGKTYLPIIPDLNILLEKAGGTVPDENNLYPVANNAIKKPEYNPTALFAMRSQMEDRFQKILEVSKLKLQQKGAKSGNATAAKWMDEYYHKSQWDKLKGWFIEKGLNALFAMTKGGLARDITEAAVSWILNDLDNKGFLQQPGSENTGIKQP